MKKTILIALFSILTLHSSTLLAQGDTDHYSRLYDKLYKAYIKEPDNVANSLAMAHFFADTLNPMRNYASAMNHITSAERNFIAIIEDRDRYKEASRLMKQKITITDIRQTKRAIINSARNYLDNDEIIPDATIDLYAEAFKDDSYTMRLVESKRLLLRFQQAKQANTLEAYKAFLANYSATSEGEEAGKLMSKLAYSLVEPAKRESQVDSILAGYLDIAQVQSAALRRKSALAFARLDSKSSPQAYRDFLLKYPGSDEYSDVLAKMDQMAQEGFSSLSTPRQFADFVHNNPDNPLADKAMENLKRLITDNRNIEAFSIYMDEFPLDVDYNDIYLQYYNWHIEEGNHSPIEKFDNENPDFPYQMALQDELLRSERYDSIDINMPFRENEFRQWTSKIYHLTGKKESFVGLQRTLQGFIASKNWKKANERIDYFSICFEDHCTDEVAELRSILDRIPDPRLNTTVVVRPAYDLSHPVMHPDGKRLFFNRTVNGVTAINCANAISGKKGQVWKSAGRIVFDNFDGNGATIFSLFDGGKKMLIGYNSDILVAQENETGWTVTETLPSPVNSPYNDFDAYMLPDSSGILIASDRPGGLNLQPSRSYFHGDTALASDIYFVPLLEKGWGNPVNLGINVNTPYMECSPYISDDLKTLYFVSDGRGGLGYGDIWVSTRDNSADWLNWSVPTNYGKEVNSGFNENFISPANDPTHLIIGSNHSGTYGAYRTTAFHTVNSKMRQVDIIANEVGIVASIANLRNQTVVSKAHPIPQFSSWQTSLYTGSQYMLMAQCDGLFFPSMVFTPDTCKSLVPSPFTETSLLALTDAGQPLPLPALMFEPNRSTPTLSATMEADNLAHYMTRHQNLAVELISHLGGNDDTFCYNLSLSRAQEIKKRLILKGVEPDRIIVSAYGNSMVKRGKARSSLSIMMHRQ